MHAHGPHAAPAWSARLRRGARAHKCPIVHAHMHPPRHAHARTHTPQTRAHAPIPHAQAFAVALAKVADDTKAQDLAVLHVAPLVSWTSYFVICTVISRPQLLAVMARMETAAEEDWDRAKQNSPGSSPWEVLDYGDVVVHVFTPDQREHYDIESFYAAAEEVPLPFLDGRPAPGAPSSSGTVGAAGAGSWSKQL
ncbi:MAG: hypothetical protein J3K34DRAFT_293543 [Monoraphidium minutum]|nr:MAG: hypothetical protein J3K34DRAFT_293543 [Monoraphidium minutum]